MLKRWFFSLGWRDQTCMVLNCFALGKVIKASFFVFDSEFLIQSTVLDSTGNFRTSLNTSLMMHIGFKV